MSLKKNHFERVPLVKDSMGRVTERFFDKFGDPRFTPNTPAANRKGLQMARAVPSNKSRGGYRVKKKDRPKRERYSI